MTRHDKLYTQRQPNLHLWIGVSFLYGILFYFSADSEFSLPLLGILCAALLFLWRMIAYRKYGYFLAGIPAAFIAGIFITTFWSHFLAAPVLNKSIYNCTVQGKITRIEPLFDSTRLTLSDVSVSKLTAEKTPLKIRLKTKSTRRFNYGDIITGSANLHPPPKAGEPNSFDFSKLAWFMQLGAVGSFKNTPVVVKANNNFSISEKFESVRQIIATKIRNAVHSNQAGVIISLIIGEQGEVTDAIKEAYRKSGIIHVLSVSGFHLTLLSIVIFCVFCKAFVVFQALSAYISFRKIAAGITFVICLLYLLISGLQIPAIRSFYMIGIALFGIMIDRNTISVRTVFIAGFLILLFHPEAAVQIGFQMSFIAVLGLVTLYQSSYQYFSEIWRRSFISKIFLFLLGCILVDLFASCTTIPFSIYHFNQFTPYSLLGNLATGILFSAFIMPLLLIAVLCMPFNLEGPFLRLTGLLLELVEKICSFIADLPCSEIRVPSISPYYMALFTLCLLWIFIFKHKIRLLGLIGFPILLIGFWATPRPDIYIADKGKTIVVRHQGTLKQIAGKKSMTTQTWATKNGQEQLKTLNATTVIIKNKIVTANTKLFSVADICIADTDTFCAGELINKRYLYYKDKTFVYLGKKDVIVSLHEREQNRIWNQRF